MSGPLNLFSPELQQEPYALYARLRRDAPVCPAEPGGLWAVTGYDEVARVLGDHRVFSSSGLDLSQRPWLQDDPFAHPLAALDPPLHTELRRLSTRAFQAASGRRLAEAIHRAAEELARDLPEGQVDFLDGFARPLQARALADLLGEPDLAGQVGRWAEVLSSGLVPQPGLEVEIRGIERTLRDLFARRRARPGDDLASTLVAAWEGRANADRELLSTLGLVVVAGWDTGVQLLANAVLCWARAPEAFEAARGAPERIPALVDEVLRFEPPVHAVDRTTREEVELGGRKLAAGSMVLAFVASANRDERRFTNPERFEVGRERGAVLSFGHGVHYCLGAPLARQVAEIALEAMLRHVQAITLDERALAWRWTLSLRTLPALPVTLRPSAAP